jgi:hypothetical protein
LAGERGDRNTKYFHQYASERRRRSRIHRLVTDDGVVMEQEAEKRALVTNYYNNLFQSNVGNRLDELLQYVQPKVSTEMNEALIKEFTAEEIKLGLDSIGDLKAPGSDGTPALFYKKYWDICGVDIIREVKHFLEGGAMPEKWNGTIVVLIQKVMKPEKLKDLRPISLCNVIYKVASKVLANRLKVILPNIIAPNQSAFVPGRLITDNVLIAYEMSHYLQNKRWGAEGYAALKLDMSEAYDRVEWSFLEKKNDV